MEQVAVQPQSQLLDQIVARIAAMTPEQRKEHEANVLAATAGMKFIPSPGPQTDAYHCKADILLYGGEAGGGKSSLILGLALTQHKRSLIMRRQYTDLSGLTEEILKINGTRQGYNGSIPPTLRTADNRMVEFGAAQRAGDEEAWMGRPHDLIGIDEAWQMLQSQIRFLIGWLRTTDEKQRTRVVLATNPPLSADGEWLISMFAPWLDPGYHRPAKLGELRWFVTDDDDRDIEVDNGKPHIFDTATAVWRIATEDELARHKQKACGVLKPMSRTFIRASVNDNPFLSKTDYASKLDSLPPAIRASLRDGNFMAGRKDDPMQVIPTDWLRLAQGRWSPKLPEGVPMCAVGVDCSGGGADPTVIAPRYDGYFPALTEIPGRETPNGDGISGHVIKIRRDGAKVGMDMGGGYGNLPYKELRNNDIEVAAHKGTEGSNGRTRDAVYGFYNKRSEVIWRFMEALDPNQPGGSVVALPHDPILIADLAAARYDVVPYKGRSCIRVESKEKIKERLARSPNRGDAVQIALSVGTRASNYQGGFQGKSRGENIRVNRGHDRQRQILRN
jgi:hypothetical protein